MNFSPQLPFDFSVSENYSFRNFLVSDQNSELAEVLQKFPEGDELFMYIWGKAGTGKSHLLQALCHDVNAEGKVEALYLPVQKLKVFGADVFSSLHHMNLICLDDFDCVIGMRDWEESLFEFFNRSRALGVKLVVSAVNAPSGLPFSLKDLASRMTWGMTYQLFELGDEDKLAALDRKARERNMPMEKEVLHYIFMRHSRDLQSLVGVLDKLDQLSLVEKRRLTIPFVREVMGWQ